jgi:hypothetical protein
MAAVIRRRKLYLYKYRAFSPLSVQALVADQVFFADPTSFNDPLDTRPCVEADLPVVELEKVLFMLVARREEAALKSAAGTIGYRGPNTTKRIEDRSRRLAKSVVADIEYQSTAPDLDGDAEDHHHRLLAHAIESELLKRYAKGIFCLGTRSACPLMWSHYGDQHRGLCIGYTAPDPEHSNLFKVEYGGSRLVQASLVAAMLDGDAAAAKAVDSAVLLQKAADWSSEREWRLLGARGAQPSPLEMSSVTFGMRCDATVKHAVVSALRDRERALRFFEMKEERGTFKLRRAKVDLNDLSRGLPIRALSALEGFDVLV